MTVIDVHTHMFTAQWLELLQKEGGSYNIQTRPDGQREVFRGNTPVVIPQKGHFDWELRIKHMNEAGIDVSVVSLTCPNVYWGGEAVSVRAAREANDNVAEAQSRYPDRIRWFASLPWEYPRRDGAGQCGGPQPDRPDVRAGVEGNRPTSPARAGAPH
jgi:aminocarboxymuconate-semialdehyde decarboxylase